MSDVVTEKKTEGEAPRVNRIAAQIMNSSTVMTVLAIVISLVVGAVLIAVTDEKVQSAAGYFFARPGDTLKAIWDAVSGAYIALFNGAIYNTNRDTFLGGIKSITDTLHHATPLIAGGLGVALAFRVGLFNIGGRGQMLVAAGAAGWVGFSFHLPVWIHLPLAVIAGIAAGAIWGGLVGYLKARTGAHEVILTIMLNYVAFYLISWMLRTPGLLQAPGTVNPESAPILPSAILPPIFGERFNLHAGFLLVIIATVFTWWLLNRSSLGFKFRAVGENPNAALTAGIDVKSMYVWGMLIAGGLMGIAGVSQVLGTITSGFSAGIDAGIGFDAITVALLGRSTPWGTFAAGILFGAFKAGGYAMQAGEGIPIDIVLVVQSVIVLFIAAPPLVRSIFFLPKPGAVSKQKKSTPNVSKEVSAK
ncbi:ABC transporter permease [Paramicrobacterium sp. CJ85]|uniref:ABC transporter permease n=1 Tax=Paramicrobacterium sp. CJ85 TaxID=3445355 RepID=UPI003F5FB373